MTPPRVKLHVLVDCDGVMADCGTAIVREINDLFGLSVSLDDCSTWDIFEALKLSKEQRAAVLERMHVPGWADKLEVIGDAVEGIRKLREMAEVRVITAPTYSDTWCADRWRWLHRNFDIHPKHVAHMEEKHLVFGHVFIDDRPSTVARWKEMHPDGVGLVWYAKHALRDHPDLPRVHSWAQVLEWVRTIC